MIYLTGATGFLGSYILLDLLEAGHKVRALKRPTSTFDQVKRVFQTFSTRPEALFSSVEWVDGDLNDLFVLEETMDGCDTVVHVAGLVSFQKKDRKRLQEVNVEATANLVNMALKKGVGKLLYVSSIAAMGRGGDDEIIHEKTVWKNSRLNSRYAVSKYCGEKEVWRGREEGLDVLVVNPAVVLGFGDAEEGVTRMYATIHKGLPFYTLGCNGYVDVRDVARAISLLLAQDVRNEKYILSAVNLDYQQLFGIIASSLGKKAPSLPVGRVLANLYRLFESLRSSLSGRKPLVTRETTLTALNRYKYDGSKILSLPGFSYTPVEKTILETGAILKKEFNW